MDLPNIKELQALLKLCRKQGVTDIELGALKIKFGDIPREFNEAEEIPAVPAPNAEELLYWSSQPDPLVQYEKQVADQ